MKVVLFLLAISLLPFESLAAQSNPFTKQCFDLKHLTANSAAFKQPLTGSFWKDRAMERSYLDALHSGYFRIDGRDRIRSWRVADSAAVVLASIVRGDLSLFKRFYNSEVATYFDNSGWSVMTYAASCNFDYGVYFLLRDNVDPNKGPGIGPFNISMLYGNNSLASRLLDNGYDIQVNYKRCKSSKFIASHTDNKISRRIYAAVTAAKCSAR